MCDDVSSVTMLDFFVSPIFLVFAFGFHPVWSQKRNLISHLHLRLSSTFLSSAPITFSFPNAAAPSCFFNCSKLLFMSLFQCFPSSAPWPPNSDTLDSDPFLLSSEIKTMFSIFQHQPANLKSGWFYTNNIFRFTFRTLPLCQPGHIGVRRYITIRLLSGEERGGARSCRAGCQHWTGNAAHYHTSPFHF